MLSWQGHFLNPFYTRKSDQKTEATANCDQCTVMPDYQSRVVESNEDTLREACKVGYC